VPAGLWRDGFNTIELAFERVDRVPNDPRPLAVLFESITIGSGQPWTPPPLRMPADQFLDAGALWLGRSKNPLVLPRRAAEALLARLGFDPVAGWSAISRGEVELNDVARSIAWGPDCEDDQTFLRRAFAILVQRGPNAIEERDLLERLRRGASRDEVIDRILKAV
jgi:hypothetical protein